MEEEAYAARESHAAAHNAYDDGAHQEDSAHEYGAHEGDARAVAAHTERTAQDIVSPLMSTEAASSIASHFDTLAATMFINDSGILRDYAQEMMRPMLKQWLDDNLPVIVERLVRAEIERVARGGRR